MLLILYAALEYIYWFAFLSSVCTQNTWQTGVGACRRTIKQITCRIRDQCATLMKKKLFLCEIVLLVGSGNGYTCRSADWLSRFPFGIDDRDGSDAAEAVGCRERTS
jgi:hypothetical protein